MFDAHYFSKYGEGKPYEKVFKDYSIDIRDINIVTGIIGGWRVNSILDIGAADGSYLRYAAKGVKAKGPLVGIEVSDHYPNYHTDLRIIRGDVLKDPSVLYDACAVSEDYDLIIMNIIMYLSLGDTGILLKKLRALSSDNTIIALRYVGTGIWGHSYIGDGKYRIGKREPVQPKTRLELIQVAHSVGFKVLYFNDNTIFIGKGKKQSLFGKPSLCSASPYEGYLNDGKGVYLQVRHNKSGQGFAFKLNTNKAGFTTAVEVGGTVDLRSEHAVRSTALLDVVSFIRHGGLGNIDSLRFRDDNFYSYTHGIYQIKHKGKWKLYLDNFTD